MCDQLKVSEIIKDRHEEASDVKHCFTDFAFKGLILSAAFFGVIIKFYPTGNSCVPYVLMWLFCGAVILVLLRILEIGIHKYCTANRNYGYVLHLARTFNYQQDKDGDLGTEKDAREVGWESAMFAWRVIQPILSDEIYARKKWYERILFPFLGRERWKHWSKSYRWWNTKSLMNFKEASTQNTELGFSFHPGSYLQKAQRLILILCTVIFFIFSCSYFKETQCMYNATSSVAHKLFSEHEWVKNTFPDYQTTPENIITKQNLIFLVPYYLLFVIFSLLFIRECARQRAERIILEEGLLSIQSCAVVWRLVAFSHLKAVNEGEENGKAYKGYTRRLVDNACIIRDNLDNIHEKLMKNIWPETESQSDQNIVVNDSKESKLNAGKDARSPGFIPIEALPGDSPPDKQKKPSIGDDGAQNTND